MKSLTLIEKMQSLGYLTDRKVSKRLYVYSPPEWIDISGRVLFTLYTYGDPTDENAMWYIHNHTRSFDTETEIPIPEENINTFFEVLSDYIKEDLKIKSELNNQKERLSTILSKDGIKKMIRSKKLEKYES